VTPAVGPGRPAPSAYEHHPGLRRLRASEEGRAWLARAGALVEECTRRWSITVGPPFDGATTSLVLPAEGSDGSPAVLKLQFPDRESEHEADALRRWDGRGAVRLLAADPERRALLLERCRPGRALTEVEPGRALAILTGVARRLLVPAGPPFRSLSDEAAGWAGGLVARWEAAGRPCERTLVDAALEYLAALPREQGEAVLLHQDLHAGNVLRAEREAWLAIDPKPLVGERAFAAAPIVRGAELGHTPAAVRRRLDAVVDELGVERDRARGWTVAQTVAWAFDGASAVPGHIEVARWLLEGR